MEFNPACSENDCSQCHGVGNVTLWGGCPPQSKVIVCPGESYSRTSESMEGKDYE